jgi:catechol 2,3-dioxygenase-like lactoylglutathione lyase family enzyme
MMTLARPPALEGVHHLKFAISDLDRSLRFYEQVFGAQRLAFADHRRRRDNALYAYILDVPGLGPRLELRLNPEAAGKQRRFDPVTLAVRDRAALRAWGAHLDRLGVARSDEITSIQAWLIVFNDPDERRLRLYTLETHGPELPSDEDNPWLGT